MIGCLKARRHESNHKFFTQNGGALLEELISFCNGRSNPICHFSEKDLLKATNCYDARHILIQEGHYKMYKGYMKDRPIIVKKYDNEKYHNDSFGDPFKDIAIGSQMSAHKNVLKVLGCCLETKTPIIVYEFADIKSLSTCISGTNFEPLPWKCRLKIARDLASAVAYLHTVFSTPVIHRDINSKNVILDENNVPKLMEFGLCIYIPRGKSHVEDDIRGTFGYIAPEYLRSYYITEKADVYSFGVLLLELLSGMMPHDLFMNPQNIKKSNCCIMQNISRVVDCRIRDEGIEQEQLLDFKTLTIRCTSRNDEERPTMIEVAKELRQIYHSFASPF
ncbi:hypothetical protein COLO4_28233 [Corchorus olitorius]|uniref:Protein kinase domain-containing protein n=1 Tax=Corchorus olitorius TaxID=93759 RepID=A0A1R3HM58_9ROSI|nr:hypothetical protein COLO4_28233 [Corchorus olitorius]